MISKLRGRSKWFKETGCGVRSVRSGSYSASYGVLWCGPVFKLNAAHVQRPDAPGERKVQCPCGEAEDGFFRFAVCIILHVCCLLFEQNLCPVCQAIIVESVWSLSSIARQETWHVLTGPRSLLVHPSRVWSLACMLLEHLSLAGREAVLNTSEESEIGMTYGRSFGVPSPKLLPLPRPLNKAL